MSAPPLAVIGAGSGLAAVLAERLPADLLEPADGFGAAHSGVAVVVGDVPAPVLGPLVELSAEQWAVQAEGLIASTVRVLQRAHAHLRPSGGRIVLVVPTLGVAGADGLVALTTAIEGVRALAKSAARQWAQDHVAVNVVAVPVGLIVPALADAARHLAPPVVPDADALVRSVAGAVRYLLGDEAPSVVGSTLIVDGGTVMAP